MIKNVIIPMAGLGKRFKKENFSTIKPLIVIDKKSIFEESIKDLPESKNTIAIINKKIFEKYSILKKILKINNIKNLQLKKNTLGQSDTCYKAKMLIKPNEDLFVHSCDYIMKYSYKKFKRVSLNCDVIIFTYKLKSSIVKNYNDFAYCKEKKGNVSKIFEKKTISKNPQNDQMIIGSFWFKKASDFFEMHEQSLKKKNYINKELYVANNINLLIKKRKKVKIFQVYHWKNLGDYFSYNQYIYWKNFFLKK
jgi:bifunctional N-acetylglucosamine-1-phosphate-uridyltransferase/glucosamine-1-phosphate-acetyltransferase GlmU-like protein